MAGQKQHRPWSVLQGLRELYAHVWVWGRERAGFPAFFVFSSKPRNLRTAQSAMQSGE